MVGRIQSQRFTATAVRPSNGVRPSGELWLNFPDYRLGMIDPTQAPVDLLPIRVYAATATYAQGDFVVNAGQLLQARTALAPKPYAVTDWNQFQPISQTDTRYLALSGGTLTGPLTLAGNPTTANGAANKSYVDTAITNLNNSVLASVSATYLPLAGGTLTGQLQIGGNGALYSIITASDRTQVAFGWNGQLYAVVGGSNIGALAPESWVSGHYLALTGGALSGPLTVGGVGITYNVAPNAHAMQFGWDGTQILAWVDGTYIGGLATEAYVGNYLPLTGGVTSGTVRVGNGRLMSSNNGNVPSVTAWDTSGNTAVGFWDSGGALALGGIDGNGVPNAQWASLTGGSLALVGYLQLGGLGASPAFQFAAGSGSYNLYFTSWCLNYNSSNGWLTWVRYDGLALFSCDNGGSLHAHQDMDAGSNVNAGNAVVAQAGCYALNYGMGLYAGGSGRVIQVASNWYFDWNSGNGDLHWVGASGINFEFRVSDGNAGNDRGAMYGYGAYINLSDERAKTDIQPSPYGLPEILQLNPIAFERTNTVTVRREHGFSAQQVQPIIPEAVIGVTQDADPLLGVSLDPIVAALVNTAKNFHQRLRVLEGDHSA